MQLYFIDDYSCTVCAEKFLIHYLYPDDKIIGFGFTCNDLIALHHYSKETITLRRLDVDGEVSIPAFDYSFTDKEELYQRLQTMAVFA